MCTIARDHMQAETTLAKPSRWSSRLPQQFSRGLSRPKAGYCCLVNDKSCLTTIALTVANPPCLPSATRPPLSNPCPCSSRLPRYSRLSRQVRACLLKLWSDQHRLSQLARYTNSRRSPNPQGCGCQLQPLCRRVSFQVGCLHAPRQPLFYSFTPTVGTGSVARERSGLG